MIELGSGLPLLSLSLLADSPMSSDKRKHRRRALSRRASLRGWDGREIASCTMSDISDGGAKVILDHPAHLPETFTLWLMDNGSVYRECQVVWQAGDVIGVQFRIDQRKQRQLRFGYQFTG
jgi:hypothetical protein